MGLKKWWSCSVNKQKSKTRSEIVKCFLFGFILFLVIFLAWANIFYYRTCLSENCFDDYLVNCDRAKFITDGNMTFKYFIEGSYEDSCVISVKLLSAQLSKQDSEKVVGKEMVCYFPQGVVSRPEDNLDFCHGELKEGFQSLFISKLYNYIVQNVGEIKQNIYGF